MAPAETALAAVAAGITAADPARILLSNLDGAAVTDGRELVHRLVRQVTAPVRWDLCMRTLADLGVTGVIELPPGRHPRRPGQAGAQGRGRPRSSP